MASVALPSFCPWTHFQSMQYSWLNVQLNCQPVKAASVGSSIYNLCPRSRAHAECSQSPPISDRFASPPLIHPTTPSIHHPQHLRHPLHLTNFYRATPSTSPPNSPPPSSPGDVGMLVTHRSSSAPPPRSELLLSNRTLPPFPSTLLLPFLTIVCALSSPCFRLSFTS